MERHIEFPTTELFLKGWARKRAGLLDRHWLRIPGSNLRKIPDRSSAIQNHAAVFNSDVSVRSNEFGTLIRHEVSNLIP